MKTFHMQFDRCYIIQHLYIYIRSHRGSRSFCILFFFVVCRISILCMQVTRIHVRLSLFNFKLCACVQSLDNLPRHRRRRCQCCIKFLCCFVAIAFDSVLTNETFSKQKHTRRHLSPQIAARLFELCNPIF